MTLSINIEISACFRRKCLKQAENYVVPNEVKDVNVLIELLNQIQPIVSEECSLNGLLDVMFPSGRKIVEHMTDSKRDMITFLKSKSHFW